MSLTPLIVPFTSIKGFLLKLFYNFEVSNFSYCCNFLYIYIYIHKPSRKNVTFLDVDVEFLSGKTITDLLVKATDRYPYQYLHYTSSHLHYTQKSILYSQALRVSRICSFEEDVKRHKIQIKLRFLNRYIQNI